MNNYWYTDAPAQQGGRFTFRYALTNGPDVSPVQAATLASEQRSPFAAIRHYNMGWQPTLSDKGAGLLSATPSGVTVLTIRPLEEGNAYLVRVHNSTSADVTANIQFPAVQIQEAYLGSVMGERTAGVNWTPHSVTMLMGKYEIKNLVVRVAANM